MHILHVALIKQLLQETRILRSIYNILLYMCGLTAKFTQCRCKGISATHGMMVSDGQWPVDWT